MTYFGVGPIEAGHVSKFSWDKARAEERRQNVRRKIFRDSIYDGRLLHDTTAENDAVWIENVNKPSKANADLICPSFKIRGDFGKDPARRIK